MNIFLEPRIHVLDAYAYGVTLIVNAPTIECFPSPFVPNPPFWFVFGP